LEGKIFYDKMHIEENTFLDEHFDQLVCEMNQLENQINDIKVKISLIKNKYSVIND